MVVEKLEIGRSQFKVSDFLGWQREKTLELSPSFQRRAVWRTGAKSLLIDSVVRGIPTPVVFTRDRIDLSTLKTIREVVDGQQRLRTLISFIDEAALEDFDPERDRFTVLATHNKDIAAKRFDGLDDTTKTRILEYEFTTHTLPSAMEDRDVLQLFARLNSTGVGLNKQELRNAEWFGPFKLLMYDLAYEQLERWRDWNIFNEDAIARMREVELTSDLVMSMLQGTTGKTQKRLDRLYEQYDQAFPAAKTVAKRFRRTMDSVEETIGDRLPRTVFSSEIYFFTLFTFLYERMYALGSEMDLKREPRKLPLNLKECLFTASTNFRTEKVPVTVLDAVRRASADTGRRRTRLNYLLDLCGGRSS
jgi:Protein of unknown function DUF262